MMLIQNEENMKKLPVNNKIYYYGFSSQPDPLLTFDPPLARETWVRMWVWYKETVNIPPPPSDMYIPGGPYDRTCQAIFPRSTDRDTYSTELAPSPWMTLSQGSRRFPRC